MHMLSEDYDEKVKIAKRLLASRTSALENPNITKKTPDSKEEVKDEKPDSPWEDKEFDEVLEDW